MEHAHQWPGEYTYCPMCATPLELRSASGQPRMRCPSCGYVHFRNPGVGAAVVIRDEAGRILLVLRGKGTSRSGLWAVPAGFVDYGEDIRAAARRELREETGLIAELGAIVHVASNFHDPAKLTVGVWFAGTVVGGRLEAGDDADDARFFALDDLPQLAFETDVELFKILRGEDAP